MRDLWWLALPAIAAAMWLAGRIKRLRKARRILWETESLDSLRRLSWQQFEDLSVQIMRHLNYKVTPGAGTKDGGIDLTAYKKGFKYVVQCKQWKANSVGVKVVREMLGVSVHEGATGGVYIFTCGRFTKDARELAKGKRVYLVDGMQICKLIAKIKAGKRKELQGPEYA